MKPWARPGFGILLQMRIASAGGGAGAIRCIFCFVLALAVARAHDLYILPQDFFVQAGQIVKVGIHNGDAFPESEASPVLARVRDTNAISASGVVPMHSLKVVGKRGVAMVAAHSAGEHILTLRTVPNLIVLEAPQFLAYLKEEGLQQVIDWRAEHRESRKAGRERYSKYAKAIILNGQPDGFAMHEVGFAIEIVPESDPYRAKPGDRLPVRVIFKGRPAAGLQVEAAWAGNGAKRTTIAGRTDADGRAVVALAGAGLWRLHALKMERCAEPEAADWESYWASLTFEVR
jgi:uncharacterized GH25 family protein